MSKKIIFFIIFIQIFFTKISYTQFTNPLDSIFNEIGKGIENVTKSISEGVQKSDEKNIDIKNENTEIETKEIEKSVTTKSVEKKVDKKEYKPQCDNPKMAELLKQNANNIKPINENSSNSNNISSSKQNTKFNQNFNQTYSRDPLLNKFFESYNLYAQSTAILMEAYGKDQEAAIIRQSIIDSKNPNKADHEKFSNTLTVVSEKSNNLKDLIYCRTEPLSAASKKKYEEAIPYAFKAVLTSVELKFMIGATAKNLKQAAQGDPLASALTGLAYMSYAPQVVEYLSSIGNTFSFILTGAKANDVEGTTNLQSALKDL
jgi:hypothetical protein